MRRRDHPDRRLGSLEADVLDALWSAGKPLSVRDVLEHVNTGRTKELAYTTVMTVMSRLAEKDVLRRRPEGRGFVYEPVAGDPAGLAVRGVLKEFGDAALAQFVDHARGDPKILKRLARLLDSPQEK